MRRPGHLVLLLLLATGAVAHAGDAPDTGRFTLGPSPDGFVRLDTRTGATSHCAYRDKQWICERFSEDDGQLRARVDALATEVGRMHAAVARLSDTVGRMAGQPATPPDAGEGAAPGFRERAVTRLMEMVRRLKQGLAATPAGA